MLIKNWSTFNHSVKSDIIVKTLIHIAQDISLKNDFEALKFSGVAAVLPAAFFPYHRFCNKERRTAADRPTKFILVLGKIMYIVIDIQREYF